jgi:hypothetical protein
MKKNAVVVIDNLGMYMRDKEENERERWCASQTKI